MSTMHDVKVKIKIHAHEVFFLVKPNYELQIVKGTSVNILHSKTFSIDTRAGQYLVSEEHSRAQLMIILTKLDSTILCPSTRKSPTILSVMFPIVEAERLSVCMLFGVFQMLL